VPLIAAEDAVVAAVRMAYRVAEAQIERSSRLARRLREAGDRAVGARSDRKAIDATEQLITTAITSGLSWLERTASDPDPVKRIMVAQYRLAGSILGLTPSAVTPTSDRGAPQGTPRAADSVPVSHPQSAGSQAPLVPMKVILKGAKRPVRTCCFEVATRDHASDIRFYRVGDAQSDPLEAKLTVDSAGRGALTLDIPRHAESGRWKAAICDNDDVQIGLIEIEL
jgi:hypothetical protein